MGQLLIITGGFQLTIESRANNDSMELNSGSIAWTNFCDYGVVVYFDRYVHTAIGFSVLEMGY